MKYCPLLKKECIGKDCAWWLDTKWRDGEGIYECSIFIISQMQLITADN